MRSTHLLLPTLLVTALLGLHHAAHAQTLSNWPTPAEFKPLHHADIVLVSNPRVRHPCRVHQVTPTGITCGVGIGRKPITYSAADIAAILQTHKDPTGKVIADVLIVGAACLAGAVLLPGTAVVVVLAVVAGLSLPIAAAMAIGDNPEPYQDTVFYLRPNTALNLPLP